MLFLCHCHSHFIGKARYTCPKVVGCQQKARGGSCGNRPSPRPCQAEGVLEGSRAPLLQLRWFTSLPRFCQLAGFTGIASSLPLTTSREGSTQDQSALEEEHGVRAPRPPGLYRSPGTCCHSVPVLVTQSCPTLCDPVDRMNLPGSSVRGLLQERILEWVAVSFSPITQTGNEGSRKLFFFKHLFSSGLLHLGCCVGSSLVAGKQGLLSGCGSWASHCGGFSCCRALALGCAGASEVAAPGLYLEHRFNECGALSFVTPRRVGSSWTRDRIHVSCIGRQILYH